MGKILELLIGKSTNKTIKKVDDVLPKISPDEFATLISEITSVRVQDEPSAKKQHNLKTRKEILKYHFSDELASPRKKEKPAGRHNQLMMDLIVSYYNGKLGAEVTDYVIHFSNGHEIWIGNKFYSYGTLYKHNQIRDSDETTSDELFLEILYLEQTLRSNFFVIPNLPKLVYYEVT